MKELDVAALREWGSLVSTFFAVLGFLAIIFGGACISASFKIFKAWKQI